MDWYPTSNAKHTFHGHREPINAVSFHPVFSSLASASSDATIKIWDWDSGELERTLKGHTKSVTDCDYDSTGKHLGSCHVKHYEFCIYRYIFSIIFI
jgi:platelet-activating factor acetylhydrolase IB subunit alpha